MRNSLIAFVGMFLLFSAFAFYVYGIAEAVRLSWGDGPVKGDYNDVLSTSIGSIQALLLANLGMLLGISVASPTSGVARQLMLSRGSAVAAANAPALTLKEKVQLAAMVVYILSLIACLAAWITDDFSSDTKDVVSIVSASGKMFIGVVLAYLTAALR